MQIYLIILAVIFALLLIIVYNQQSKNTDLVEEIGLLKGKMEALNNKSSDKGLLSLGGPLTVEGIENAIRYAGYVPDNNEKVISFMAAGDKFFVDATRLPCVFVLKQYNVDPNEWEMDLLKHAAHLMSDDLIMVKATFFEDEDGTTLRFFVAALDANNASFQENLTRYLRVIEDGRSEMNDIYEKLVKGKRDAALAINPVLPANQTETKVTS